MPTFLLDRFHVTVTNPALHQIGASPLIAAREFVAGTGAASPTATVTRSSCVISTTALLRILEFHHAPATIAWFNNSVGYACVRGFCASAGSGATQCRSI